MSGAKSESCEDMQGASMMLRDMLQALGLKRAGKYGNVGIVVNLSMIQVPLSRTGHAQQDADPRLPPEEHVDLSTSQKAYSDRTGVGPVRRQLALRSPT